MDGWQSHSAAQICCVAKGIQVLLGFRILNQIWFVFPSSNKCDLYKVCDSKMHLNKTLDTIGGFFLLLPVRNLQGEGEGKYFKP